MKHTQRECDVIVVGSGAGGGIAAYVLTQRGLNVLMLEAGRHYDARTETPMFQIEADAPLNGASTPDKIGGFYDATVDGGLVVPGEPYTVAAGSRFDWWRARMLGGRTNHWGRVALRYGPNDFHTYSQHGIGVDWPIGYEDIAPYYDRVERLIGVFGSADGIENSPDSPPGILLPPPSLRAYERWIQMVLASRLNVRVVANRGAILTQPLNGRPACLYATDCHRGCSIGANFQTPTVLLPLALATRRLEIRTQSMVYEVVLDKHGRAGGVRYIDRVTGSRRFQRARAVVLAASACETSRILLNSTSASFPNGLANSSGQVGRNLTDSISTSVRSDIPALQGLPPFNDDGTSIGHAYIPWGALGSGTTKTLPFATEYHIHMFGGRTMPAVGFTDLPSEGGKPLYGQVLRERVRRRYGSQLTMASWGGMIPNPDSRCEIDPAIKDRWGIPVLRFHWKWGLQETEQARHAAATMSEMISAMGGKPIVGTDADTGLTTSNGGGNAHEVGTTRMGAEAANSVLNAFGHSWDVRNLYIADGASFASHADKNPTETILALAWRACDHLADSFLRKDI
jgi:choline dehydrogenase-like flavoprotein